MRASSSSGSSLDRAVRCRRISRVLIAASSSFTPGWLWAYLSWSTKWRTVNEVQQFINNVIGILKAAINSKLPIPIL
jgi:hypothetical protein